MNPAYKPMLATLVDEPFDAKGWVYETKWDGFRLITEKRRDNVTLWSRCVEFDRAFESITHLGVPDIRLIVYKGVPVMGMLRLPTSESEGKTNLHRGAIGAGIDLASGRTLTAVWRNSVVTQHPDTLANVSGSSRRARISRIWTTKVCQFCQGRTDETARLYCCGRRRCRLVTPAVRLQISHHKK